MKHRNGCGKERTVIGAGNNGQLAARQETEHLRALLDRNEFIAIAEEYQRRCDDLCEIVSCVVQRRGPHGPAASQDCLPFIRPVDLLKPRCPVAMIALEASRVDRRRRVIADRIMHPRKVCRGEPELRPADDEGPRKVGIPHCRSPEQSVHHR